MNPINSSATNGQQVGVSPSNPINDPNFSSRQGSNTFDLSFQNLLTARFGEVVPFFYMPALGRDRIELRSSIDLRTYTLAAPLMSQVRMKKSFYSVPLKAIMPNTWNYLFVNPVKGNDVPDNAYCYIDLFKLAYWLCDAVSSYEKSSDIYRIFMLFMLIYSKGSLLDYLGISTHQFVQSLDYTSALSSLSADLSADSLDGYFDQLILWLSRQTAWSLQLNYSDNDFVTQQPHVSKHTISAGDSLSQIRSWFYLYFEHPDSLVVDLKGTLLDKLATSMASVLSAFVTYYKSVNTSVSKPTVKLEVNLYKVIAYQMAVSQFYTNDHVDSVYSSDLWMSNMKALVFKMVKETSSYTFRLNGVDVVYDIFSNYFLNILTQGFGSSFDKYGYYFWFNLFTFRRSLRYGDYFCSSRPQPLAVGDVSVPVVGENVSVIDINKNLHIQRFLNAVNRVGSNIVDYAKGIFGYRPQAVDPAPNFISDEYFIIGKDEIDNTSENQGTVNTNLVSQDSRFAFDVNLTDPSVILGLVSFEVLGAYPYTVERDNFHKSRYDMFNPFLQHIGDQEVKQIELGNVVADDVPFGYQVRYAEYKFKYSQQHGGFNDVSCALWSMPLVNNSDILSEDFIRYSPEDFDKFYKSLTYSSLANYFHFQISFQNSVRANRAMDFQPTLLG